MTDKLYYENTAIINGYKTICGIDEVGRGALFGCVLAAAVIMPLDAVIEGVDDSKILSVKKRNILYKEIINRALAYSVFLIESETIDRVNIYNATRLAMLGALNALDLSPDFLLIDAMKIDTPVVQMPLVKGDSKSYSIACASIIAKVTRDAIMDELDLIYPEYALSKNKGYGTAQHLDAIKRYGATGMHRHTFSPILEIYECERTLF